MGGGGIYPECLESKSSTAQSNISSTPHKLIIGDNYPALLNLLIGYKNKIKVIYIDPPYGKDKMGEFAKTNYHNAITRDNLLSMLYPRLQLAKELLRDDGVIFCSIDDKNQAYVKCLFDEVFGEENFVSSFIWQKKSGGGRNKFFYEGHDYILIYAKNKEDFGGLFQFKEKSSINSDFIRKVYGKYTNNAKIKEILSKYPTQLIEHRNLMFEELEIFRKEQMITEDKYQEIVKNLKEGVYFLKPYNDKFNLICKYNDENISLMYSIIQGFFNSDGDTELNEQIFSKCVFADPKPTKLLIYILQHNTESNDIILDFFAGSGTTGHAVLELNRQDGGNRQFILVTNNEKTESNPNGIAKDVTSKRLSRIMRGRCYDGSEDFKWREKNTPYGGSLEVSMIEHVSNFENQEGKSAFCVIDERLYGLETFKSLNEKIAWVCENFRGTQKRLSMIDGEGMLGQEGRRYPEDKYEQMLEGKIRGEK